jgi:DNA N-6-adenine-methyltransferase (Dam)
MMKTALATKDTGTDVAIYDPVKVLQTIVVAGASEKHWARAKDSTKLFDAISAKIKAQAEYVCWRDSKVIPSQKKGKQKKADGVPEQGPHSLPDADPGKQTAERWRKRFCLKSDAGTVIDQDKLAVALDEAQARALRVVEQQPKGTERGTAGTGEFERYTPATYIESARKVLGTIDLDPCTCDQAQATVRADKFFTVDDDGLTKDWTGKVWINPPYHRELQPKFVAKLVAEIGAGRVTEAIMLTNNSTDTEWFRQAAEACDAICFTMGRVGFTQPGGQVVAPTQGQAFFYFGDWPERFRDEFATIGFGVSVIWHYTKVAAGE